MPLSDTLPVPPALSGSGPVRLLGVDLGERRVGLAVADLRAGTIRPLATLRRGEADRDAASIARIATEQMVDAIVVGLPLLGDGTEGSQAASTRDWVAQMAERLDLPIGMRDERFSTLAAQARGRRRRRGSGGGPPTGPARRGHSARIDREAAALILQAEIDARAGVAG